MFTALSLSAVACGSSPDNSAGSNGDQVQLQDGQTDLGVTAHAESTDPAASHVDYWDLHLVSDSSTSATFAVMVGYKRDPDTQQPIEVLDVTSSDGKQLNWTSPIKGYDLQTTNAWSDALAADAKALVAVLPAASSDSSASSDDPLRPQGFGGDCDAPARETLNKVIIVATGGCVLASVPSSGGTGAFLCIAGGVVLIRWVNTSVYHCGG
jgi:hypothetical protein